MDTSMTESSIIVEACVPAKIEIDYNSQSKWGGHNTVTTHAVIPVEVLTVHFSKRTMRVRYIMSWYGKEKVQTIDISADPFFQQFEVKRKN